MSLARMSPIDGEGYERDRQALKQTFSPEKAEIATNIRNIHLTIFERLVTS